MSRFGLGFTGAVDQYTKILLHMEGANGGTSFLDSNLAGSSKTWTPTNATTSTASKQFGNTSMLAASGKISTPNSSDFALGAADFTIDFWLNRNGNNGALGLFGQTGASLTTSAIGAAFLATNVIAIYAFGTVPFFSTVTTITDSNWHHIALVRHGSSFKIYIDGASDAHTGTSSAAISALTSNWYVGALGDAVGEPTYSGYIDEFRLSVGIARWTSNFTPPSAPYR